MRLMAASWAAILSLSFSPRRSGARATPEDGRLGSMKPERGDGGVTRRHDGQKSSGSRDVIRPQRGRSPHAPAEATEAATAAVRRLAVTPMQGYEPDVLIFSAGLGGESNGRRRA